MEIKTLEQEFTEWFEESNRLMKKIMDGNCDMKEARKEQREHEQKGKAIRKRIKKEGLS